MLSQLPSGRASSADSRLPVASRLEVLNGAESSVPLPPGQSVDAQLLLHFSYQQPARRR